VEPGGVSSVASSASSDSVKHPRVCSISGGGGTGDGTRRSRSKSQEMGSVSDDNADSQMIGPGDSSLSPVTEHSLDNNSVSLLFCLAQRSFRSVYCGNLTCIITDTYHFCTMVAVIEIFQRFRYGNVQLLVYANYDLSFNNNYAYSVKFSGVQSNSIHIMFGVSLFSTVFALCLC
jgi:hypothetical protein